MLLLDPRWRFLTYHRNRDFLIMWKLWEDLPYYCSFNHFEASQGKSLILSNPEALFDSFPKPPNRVNKALWVIQRDSEDGTIYIERRKI